MKHIIEHPILAGITAYIVLSLLVTWLAVTPNVSPQEVTFIYNEAGEIQCYHTESLIGDDILMCDVID